MPDMSPHLLQVLQLVIFLSYNLGNNTEVIRFGVIVIQKETLKLTFCVFYAQRA